MPDLDKPGLWLLAAGITALGVIGVATEQLIEGLQPVEAPNRIVALINGGILLVSGPGLLVARYRDRGALLLVTLMGVSLALQISGLLAAPTDVTLWVSAAQAVAIAAALCLLIKPESDGARLAARIVVGAMLILFGAVHLMYPAAIAGMIPAWMPGQALWPWATGAGQTVAGLAVVSGVFGRPATALVGAMFTSWVLVVHLPRIAAAPSSGSEWTFMALAFALTGVVWTVNGALARNGGDFPSRTR
ncbi:MAG: DoxX family protein [Phenylobacterium sp.]|uniref:DoxX family protein n=1 Tax=Brevundimonas sp. TaxID=1871086 RepID=UPI0027378D21|nr:DoxX family protein [Brevundimonas sp.]MDP3803094.1 DoxX family protein [Brevundimonas sp.]MDZ4374695.1 DoxX family protein [Phenylobacterium sp.]